MEVPFLHFSRIHDCFVKGFYASDPLFRLLKQTVSDISHNFRVLSDFGGNAHQDALLWREVNVLALLLYLEEGLLQVHDFNIVGSQKVIFHGGSLLGISLVKIVRLRAHIPSDGVYLVGSIGTVLSHDDCTLEFPVNSFLVMTSETIVNEGEAVIDGEELRDVINNKEEPFLVDP